jgi:hypothetical protein
VYQLSLIGDPAATIDFDGIHPSSQEVTGMAVAVLVELHGIDLEDYDRVGAALGYAPGGPGAPGGLFHWVTKTDAGIRVTDVWQDKQTFERFVAERLTPAFKEAGVDAQPQITFFDVHNYLTAG